jgi:hypothetical protein
MTCAQHRLAAILVALLAMPIVYAGTQALPDLGDE